MIGFPSVFQFRRNVLPAAVTVVTVAFGNSSAVETWIAEWSGCSDHLIISDNGGVFKTNPSPEVTVLPYTCNTGFGAGINRAVAAAETPLVLITNPDTLPVDGNSLPELIRMHSRNMFSTGLTMDSNGKPAHSTGIWPDIPWIRHQITGKAESLWRERKTDWIQGSLILVNRDEFVSMGGFSGRFPLYFEDVELCARAEAMQMKMNFVPGAGFIHIEGTGSSGSAKLRLSTFHWGLVEFFRIHRPDSYRTARRLVLLKCLLRAALFLFLNPDSAAGYYKGFKAIARNTPPVLPGRACG